MTKNYPLLWVIFALLDPQPCIKGLETLPPNSVVLLGSVTALGRMGTGGYADTVAKTMRIVREKLGGSVVVAPLPPVLLGGVNSGKVVRCIRQGCGSAFISSGSSILG